ncbi:MULTISPECIES: hypothetical protein [unclassified Kitasatospora]|uniref:hypothetical protein n=1 Tax=unclassified Kitasatospora TaxID=2633591 RepID=UPI00382049DB
MSLKIALPSQELRRRCEYTTVRITTGGTGYEDGAVVPAGPWHPVTTEMCRQLQPEPETPDPVLVELVSVTGIEQPLASRGVQPTPRPLLTVPTRTLPTAALHGMDSVKCSCNAGDDNPH